MIWDRTNRPAWLRCAVGVFVAIIAAAIRLQFLGILELRAPFLTFFAAVAVAALYGGLGAGLLATAVSAALADYFWMEPVRQFGITNSADLISMVVFLASGALISYLAEAAYRAQARAHKAEEQSRLAAEREKAALELQQSESKYRELLQNANNAIIRWKRDGTIAFFSEYAQKFFGYSEEEVIGKSVNILVPEQESTGGDLTQLVQDIVNHPEKYVSNINENILRDGSRVWMAWTNRPVFDQKGQVMEILAVGIDITERKQAEETLRTTVQRFHKILSNIFSGILVVTEDDRIEFVNQNFCDQFDFAEAPSDLIGLTAQEMLQKVLPAYADPEAYLARIQQILSQTHCIVDEEVLMRNGRVLLRDYIPILIDGKPDGRMWQHRDITERKQAEEELRLSEEKFALAFANNPAAIAMSRLEDGLILEVNDTWVALNGYSREEAIGHSAREMSVWPTTEASSRFVQELRAKGSVRGWEQEFLKKSGEVFVAQLAAQILTVRGETVILSTFVDITERKRAEKEIHKAKEESERHAKELEALMDAVPALIWITRDTECLSMTGNRAVYEFLGMPTGENVSKTAPEAVRPVHFKALRYGVEVPLDELPMQQAARGKGMQNYELEYVFEDGTSKITLGNTTPLYDVTGQAYGAIAAFVDITERKQMEDELRKSRDQLDLRVLERTADLKKVNDELLIEIQERRRADEAVRASEREFRLLADAMPQIVWITRPDGWNIYFNQQWLDYTGQTLEESYGHGWNKPFHPEDQQRAWDAWQNATKNGAVYDLECRLRRADGVYRWWLVRGVPVVHERGTVLKWFGTCTDIDERKRMEESLHKSLIELELSNQARTATIAKLEESNQALRDFASIASHDLQEPLRKVKTFGGMLKQKCGDLIGEEGFSYLERVLDANQRMQSLLTALLEYSRLSTRADPFVEVELAKIICEVLSDLEVRIEKTGGVVHVGNLPVISADPTQMRQLFQNLIGNALKFHKPDEKPKVQVHSVSNTDSGYQIIVEDNGIGFEEQYLEKIFAPFQRLHGKSSQYEGTGMGLAICKKIVERHGGSIRANSEPGKGSTFIVRLPVKQARLENSRAV